VQATIDVGSNTVRLLLGNIIAGHVEPFLYARRITRLKGGQSGNGHLSVEAMDRTLLALREFSVLLQAHMPSAIRAVGTAALRQAHNADLFLKQVSDATGVAVEIISGDEEARLSALGVTAALSPVPEFCLVVDVGGGSTEFVLLKQGRVLAEHSIPLGVVSLAESHQGIESLTDHIRAQVAGVLASIAQKTGLVSTQWDLVGTAGTATTLAALSMQMTDYDWRRVNNYQLTAAELERLYALLNNLSVEEREALPGMEQGRGDLILHGIAIYQAVIKVVDAEVMTISDFGLLEGVLVDLAGR